jgi:hypothetical protein
MRISSNMKFAFGVFKPYTLVYMHIVKWCQKKSKTLNAGTRKP